MILDDKGGTTGKHANQAARLLLSSERRVSRPALLADVAKVDREATVCDGIHATSNIHPENDVTPPTHTYAPSAVTRRHVRRDAGPSALIEPSTPAMDRGMPKLRSVPVRRNTDGVLRAAISRVNDAGMG